MIEELESAAEHFQKPGRHGQCWVPEYLKGVSSELEASYQPPKAAWPPLTTHHTTRELYKPDMELTCGNLGAKGALTLKFWGRRISNTRRDAWSNWYILSHSTV